MEKQEKKLKPKPKKENIGKRVRNYVGKEAKKRAPSPYKKLMKTLNPNWDK